MALRFFLSVAPMIRDYELVAGARSAPWTVSTEAKQPRPTSKMSPRERRPFCQKVQKAFSSEWCGRGRHFGHRFGARTVRYVSLSAKRI